MNTKFSFDKYTIEVCSKACRNYLSIELPTKEDNPGTLTYSNEHLPKLPLEYIREMGYIIKPKINFSLVNHAIQELL